MVLQTREDLEELIDILNVGLLKARKLETREGDVIVKKIYHRIREYQREYKKQNNKYYSVNRIA